MEATKNKPIQEILKRLSDLEVLLKNKEDKLLSFKEACEYLGYAPSYLYKLTHRRLIPCYKPTGKILFFTKVELDDWIRGKYGKRETEKRETKDEKME